MHAASSENVVARVNINSLSTDQRTIDNSTMFPSLSDIPDHDVPIPTTRVQDARMSRVKLYAKNFVCMTFCVNIVTELDPLFGLLIIYLNVRKITSAS